MQRVEGIHTVDADDFSHLDLCLFRSVKCRKRNYQQEDVAEVEVLVWSAKVVVGKEGSSRGISFRSRWVVHKINNASTGFIGLALDKHTDTPNDWPKLRYTRQLWKAETK